MSLAAFHPRTHNPNMQKIAKCHRTTASSAISKYKSTLKNSWADQPPADHRFKCDLEMKINVAKIAGRTGRQRNHRYNDISNEKSKRGGPAASGDTAIETIIGQQNSTESISAKNAPAPSSQTCEAARTNSANCMRARLPCCVESHENVCFPARNASSLPCFKTHVFANSMNLECA